jgi:hypothetical protein
VRASLAACADNMRAGLKGDSDVGELIIFLISLSSASEPSRFPRTPQLYGNNFFAEFCFWLRHPCAIPRTKGHSMRVISPKGLQAIRDNAASPQLHEKASNTLRERWADDPAFREEVMKKRQQTAKKFYAPPPKPRSSPY